MRLNPTLFAILVVSSTTPAWAKPEALELDQLEFSVATNVPAFKFTGKAQAFTGSVERGAKGVISLVQFNVPVQSLSTHMDMRDKHMRERVFKAADGSFPDVKFASKQVTCKGTACDAKGTLEVAGKKSDVAFTFNQPTPNVAEGEFKLDLGKMGIEAPSNMGVKVKPEIPVKFKVHVR